MLYEVITMFAGRRVAGLPGFLAAFLGILLPPFAAILLLAALLGAIGDWPVVQGFLDGAFAVVPGLTAALAFNMIRKRRWTPLRAVMTVITSYSIHYTKLYECTRPGGGLLGGRWEKGGGNVE